MVSNVAAAFFENEFLLGLNGDFDRLTGESANEPAAEVSFRYHPTDSTRCQSYHSNLGESV